MNQTTQSAGTGYPAENGWADTRGFHCTPGADPLWHQKCSRPGCTCPHHLIGAPQ